jgi:hypothetical protein
MGKILIWDEKNSVPGSAINIPDPQHCKKERRAVWGAEGIS